MQILATILFWSVMAGVVYLAFLIPFQNKKWELIKQIKQLKNQIADAKNPVLQGEDATYILDQKGWMDLFTDKTKAAYGKAMGSYEVAASVLDKAETRLETYLGQAYAATLFNKDALAKISKDLNGKTNVELSDHALTDDNLVSKTSVPALVNYGASAIGSVSQLISKLPQAAKQAKSNHQELQPLIIKLETSMEKLANKGKSTMPYQKRFSDLKNNNATLGGNIESDPLGALETSQRSLTKAFTLQNDLGYMVEL
ncbi:MAG: hypothetical protein K2X81_10870 [Candidatus Obscuribacterales bacterium]|jgi:hypothetical protein|nr:hypothetical protein [Candidatus Obscuribacterales bacterium]